MTIRAEVEWTDDGTGRLPVFFGTRRRIVDPLHDYIAELAERKRSSASPMAYASTVDAATYALLSWLRYLESRRLTLWSVRDSVMRLYRKRALDDVKRSGRSKNNERVAKRTVNTKIEWIYRFYAWAEQAGLCKGVIGLEAPLVSTLLEHRQGACSRGGDTSRERRGRYPCCFTDVKGRGSGPQYFATADDKRKILKIIAACPNHYIRERDHLIIELSDRVGWRAGTLTGLKVTDFSAERFDEGGDGDYSVCPSVQKFGHTFSFDVPAALAARVIRFIEQRAAWLKERKWDERRAQGMLFLNANTGQPFRGKTIVQLVGKYFRAIGVPARVGSGHHSLRRKFSVESTHDDLEARRQLGLSVAVEDVLNANAQRLGQRNIGSQAPYQRAVRDTTRASDAKTTRRRLQEAEAENADKDKRIAELEATLAMLTERDDGTGRRLVPRRRRRRTSAKPPA